MNQDNFRSSFIVFCVFRFRIRLFVRNMQSKVHVTPFAFESKSIYIIMYAMHSKWNEMMRTAQYKIVVSIYYYGLDCSTIVYSSQLNTNDIVSEMGFPAYRWFVLVGAFVNFVLKFAFGLHFIYISNDIRRKIDCKIVIKLEPSLIADAMNI